VKFKKGHGVLCEGVAAKYATMKELRLEYDYSVSMMLKVFCVSRSGYYAWLKHRPSKRKQESLRIETLSKQHMSERVARMVRRACRMN
jgi:hypothetical protein